MNKTEIRYIVHSNKYGWVIRLGGWTGPTVSGTFASKEDALRSAVEGERGIDWCREPCPIEQIMVST